MVPPFVEVKNHVLNMGFQVLYILAPDSLPDLISYYSFLCTVCYFVMLFFLEYSRNALRLQIYSLPGKLLPQLSSWLAAEYLPFVSLISAGRQCEILYVQFTQIQKLKFVCGHHHTIVLVSNFHMALSSANINLSSCSDLFCCYLLLTPLFGVTLSPNSIHIFIFYSYCCCWSLLISCRYTYMNNQVYIHK